MFFLDLTEAPGNPFPKQSDGQVVFPWPKIHKVQRLMTMCLPSNLLFDKAITGFFHLYKDIHCSNRMLGMCCCTRLCQTASTQVGWWEPPIFIHDKETALVCWHRLLHLHAVIDCLPLPGHSVHHQIDELVSFFPFPCHPAFVQWWSFKNYVVPLFNCYYLLKKLISLTLLTIFIVIVSRPYIPFFCS